MKEVIVKLSLEIQVRFKGIPARSKGVRTSTAGAVCKIHWMEEWDWLGTWMTFMTVGNGKNETMENCERRLSSGHMPAMFTTALDWHSQLGGCKN